MEYKITINILLFFIQVVLIHGIMTGAPSMMLIEEEIMRVSSVCQWSMIELALQNN